MHDPRVGRFLSFDPLSKSFPWNSPFSYAENDVIRCIDLDGLEKVIYTINIDHDNKTVTSSKLELENAGKLGKGIAVKLNIHTGKNDVTNYFYGSDKENLDKFIISYESRELTVYQGKADKDGVLTVGIGHMVSGDKEKSYFTKGCYITNSECDKLFSSDLPKYIGKADKALGDNWEKFNQFKKDAFTDIGFNKGPGYLSEYTEDVGDYFLFQFYNRHKVEKTPGILKRRVGEYLLTTESVYYHFDVSKKKPGEYIEKLIIDNEPKDKEPESK